MALIISLLKGGLDDMVIEASNFFTCTVLCKKLYHVQLLRQNGASGLAQESFCKMTLAHQNARCKYFDEENSTESRFYLMDHAKNCTIAHKLHTCASAKTAPNKRGEQLSFFVEPSFLRHFLGILLSKIVLPGTIVTSPILKKSGF